MPLDEPKISVPILGPSDWIAESEKSEAGEPLPNPFDGFLPPLMRGRATLLGGPTEGGKTALALQYFRYVLEGGHRGAYITLEMTPADLYERFVNQFESEEECKKWIIDHDAHISQPFISPAEIEYVVKQGFDLVVIDHAHDLDYLDRRELEVEINRLMGMAPAYNVAVLMAAQLRRPDPMFPRPPSKHDFKETGKFEQKAAVILALYQEDESSRFAEIYNLKNRFGPKYKPLPVYLDEKTVTFIRES